MSATSIDLSQIKTDALSAASTFRTLIGLGSSATLNAGSANGVATLGADSKLTAAQIPDISLISYLGSVASQAAMLALSGQQGDWCVRSDLSTTWVITGSDPTLLANWTQLSYPSVPVQSVFGRTGAVVGVSTDYSSVGITNTAIGATNPSTGAFTTLSTTGRITTPSILLSGNYSSTAWTTSGVGLSHTARTLTDTSSTGTVATAYTNVLGGNTIAASNATTFTDYASLFIGSPTAGSNVTITNAFSLITQGAARFGGDLSLSTDVFLVRDAANALALRNATSAQALRIYKTYSGGGTNFERGVLDWQTTSDVFRIGTEAGGTGTVRNIALVGGNVGIGTTGPSEKLSVRVNTASSNISASFINDDPNQGTNVWVGQNTSSKAGYFSYYGSGQSAYRGLVANTAYFGASSGAAQISINTVSSAPITFCTDDWQERMRVTSSGLGIGTTSVSYPLEVLALTTAPSICARFTNSNNGNNNVQIRFRGANANADLWAFGNAVATNDATRNFDVYDLVANVNRLRIDSNGNVGISNNSPAAKLDILDTTGAGSGSLQASALNIAQTWNTTGTPTAFKLNVTDTASNAASLFAAFQFAGVSRYEFAKTAFRLYNTNDASTANYERAKIAWSSNVLQIGTEKLGTGAARALELQTDGTTRLTISTTGAFTIADALNVSVGTTTGTKIGTATTQKLGFYNATPVVQPAAVADATDAASVITQLNLLLARMRDIGLIAT